MRHASYEQLDDELARIHVEVQALKLNQHVFWEVQKMIRENPHLRGKSSTFYGWMGNMYAGAMAAAVRRLIDRRQDSISFIRLLAQVKANPSCVSRSEYKRRCTNSSLPKGYLDTDYDKLVGKGKAQPDPATIDEEIKELEARTKLLRRFANEHVAHIARNQATNLPTFQDLDGAIDYLEQLVKRYLHLFRGAAMTTVLPTFLYDWKEIFRYAWLDDAEGETKPN